MKPALWIITASIIVIIVLSGSVFYFSFLYNKDSEAQLNIDNLTAYTNGQVSFNVTLNKAESEELKEVILNNTNYEWSDGSTENSTIFRDETKHWSINLGNLQTGSNIEVIIETRSASNRSNTTVKSLQNDEPEYLYDLYGAVGIFNEGIHIVATSQDPTKIISKYETEKDYWEMLKEHETTTGTENDFISIILSRGDKPTGGYAINVKSFGWLESYPVKFRFHVNTTDPGEGLLVTQALTNPLVIVPIGKLTPGEYNIEVNITWFTETIDENQKTVYTPIMTFAPIEWKQTLTITGF